MKTEYLWRPLVSAMLTVLIFAKREWSVCGSMDINISQEVATSREALAGRFDGSSLEVIVSQGVKGAATKYNTGTSTTGAMSVNKRRMLIHDSVQINPINPNAEVEVLIAFKSGITSDPLGVLNSWRGNDSHSCGWEGVVCSNNSNHVTALNLGGLQLAGTISNLLGELLLLEQLDLSGNFLTGSIPTSLTNCSNLLYVNMSSNDIIGNIPHLVGRLASLQTLDLSINNLTGEIPDTLGNCSSLRHLDLSTNYLSGGILMNVGQLSNLEFFALYNNFFSGDIPISILNITSLSVLDFEGNTLTGTIPEEIGLLIRLEFLRLGTNEFKEQIIPRSITNLTSLQIIRLEECQLIGTIPHDIGKLISLSGLYVYSNGLTGVFPSSLSNCSLLQYLMVGDNPFDPQVFPPWIVRFLRNLVEAYIASTNLEGEIPDQIGQLSHLEAFEAWSNTLTGRIPPSFGNCSLISSFDLRNNSLTGDLPPELGSLPLVKWFEIGSNLFAPGPFPTFIYNFTRLNEFGLEYNKFNGILDGDIGRFQQLVYFGVNNNNIEGPIPDSISNCSILGDLDLGGNSLTGEIPPGLSNLSNLETLVLQNNNFHGRIPRDLTRSFQLLQYFDLSGNNFEGNIPTDIGKLVNLQNLNMSGNSFVGILPSSLGNCTQLLSLDLSKNKLFGSIPGDAFASLTSLTTIDLAQNLFSGLWPSQIGLLTKLRVINISANNLSGSIPLSLGGCFLLDVLDLSMNNFTGPIPQDLDLLTNLTFFNASYNNFDGPVPDLGVFKTNLTAASFLGNPALCGRILGPQRQCPNAAPPSRRSHCRGFKCTYIWIPLVAIVGAIFVVGVSFAIFRYSRAKTDNVKQKLVMYTVNPGMMFTESDIFTVIDSGEHNVIGVGAQSIVYRALSREGETVAIKIFREIKAAGNQDEVDKERWEKELESEAHTLGQLRHRNIIKVFSLCFSLDVKAIILEYMAKGSLHALLHTNGPCELTWEQRFKVLLGVTHGMVYLHHEFPNPIIHRDLKPSNILLDEDMEPKVCDFGISRFVTNVDGEATASTCCGTFGYMAPEYGMGARLSTKGDVYSYGVVLLELLTAKESTRANSMSLTQNDGLVDVVSQSNQASAIGAFELLDLTLKIEGAGNANSKEQMMLTMRVGLLCTSLLPQNRPSMRIVLEMLLEIQELGQGTVHPQRTLDDLIQEEVVLRAPDNDVD